MISVRHKAAALELGKQLEQQTKEHRDNDRKIRDAQNEAIQAAREVQLSAEMERIERIIEETKHRLLTRHGDDYVLVTLLAPSEVGIDMDGFHYLRSDAVAATYLKKFFEAAGRLVRISKEPRSWGDAEYEMTVL